MKNLIIVPNYKIESKIYWLRGRRVMIDSDLAALYGVATKVFNQAVKRNKKRFPVDFMFQLTWAEAEAMRSQIVTGDEISRSQFVTLNRGQNIKYLPHAFTEHGVVMLSSVLKSKKAVQVSIAVVNAFIKMREYIATHKQILDKLKKHDENFIVIFDFLKKLASRPGEPVKQKQIGFRPKEEK